MLSEVGHPNVVDATALLEWDGHAALVMPLADTDLDVYMRRVPYSVKTMQRIGAQAMRGLDHLHVRGILHLDVKPQNLGIVYDGDGVRCVLLDLGSAVFANRLRPGDRVRTTAGAFLAPELALGRVGFAADVFSAGRVLQALRCRASDDGHALAAYDLALGPLMEDMTRADDSMRPTSRGALSRMGEDEAPPAVEGPFWQSWAASVGDGDAAWLLCHDPSRGVQKIVTLVRSGGHLDNAFWLLQEAARRGEPVEGVLHYFYDRLHLTRLGCYFFARALDHLSRRPGFVLPADARLPLWAISASCACERAVLRALLRSADADLLAWCGRPDLRWGSRREDFAAFVGRLQAESSC